MKIDLFREKKSKFGKSSMFNDKIFGKNMDIEVSYEKKDGNRRTRRIKIKIELFREEIEICQEF